MFVIERLRLQMAIVHNVMETLFCGKENMVSFMDVQIILIAGSLTSLEALYCLKCSLFVPIMFLFRITFIMLSGGKIQRKKEHLGSICGF